MNSDGEMKSVFYSRYKKDRLFESSYYQWKIISAETTAGSGQACI